MRDAFLAVPRELFVPDFARANGLDAVYRNDVIATKTDTAGMSVSSSSAPSIMAIMLEQLDLERGHRVLEIGAGTGYNAALIKHIVGSTGKVVSVDIDPVTAREARANLRNAGRPATVVAGDGRRGWAPGAPYDRVIATASSANVPRAWFRQVVVDGLIELPLSLSETARHPQVAVSFRKERHSLRSVTHCRAGFMEMRPGADAPSIDVPYVDIRAHIAGKTTTIAMLSGRALSDLDDGGKRRVLGLALGEHRKTRVRIGKAIHGLHAYLGVAAPQDRLVAGGFGLVDARASSFAYLSTQNNRFTVRAAGGVWAERRLLGLIEGWKRIGSPDLDALRIHVTYGKDEPRAWRTVRRGDCVFSFDWAKSPN